MITDENRRFLRWGDVEKEIYLLKHINTSQQYRAAIRQLL